MYNIFDQNLIKFRKKILSLVYIGLIFLLLLKYYSLQIVQHEAYKLKAGNNSLRKIILNAPRGLIFDRAGNSLVNNRSIYDINIIPNDFDTTTFNYNLLERTVDIDKFVLDSMLIARKKSAYKYNPVLIKRQIDFKTKSILEENKLDLNGLYFSQFPIRTYTSKCDLTHVLGYLRQDNNKVIGFSGVEKYYENNLKGIDGVEYHLVDRLGTDQGKYIIDKNLNPVQGDSLILTIDQNLQQFTENLSLGLKGTIIVMKPQTGEIYAMNSFPSYNLDSFVGPVSNNDWKKLNNQKQQVFNNRAIHSAYPPGSIFKLILSAVALENNIIDHNWKVNCKGEYQFYDTKFHCWKEEGHGTINLTESIQKSCNIYFYNLIQKMDFDLWSKEMNYFHFGQKVGIDLPFEKVGLIPNREYMSRTYKDRGGWSGGHLLNLSIGQGEVLTTPIQIINLINIISNEGYSYVPHINMNLEKNKVNYRYSEKVFQIIKKGMFDAVNKLGGTGYNAKINNNEVKIYGKTGTVQLCSDCEIEPHAWFAGFIELNDGDVFTICVLIENGGKGSEKPAKIAKKIFNFIMQNNV